VFCKKANQPIVAMKNMRKQLIFQPLYSGFCKYFEQKTHDISRRIVAGGAVFHWIF
jgi:hypothetical protein